MAYTRHGMSGSKSLIFVKLGVLVGGPVTIILGLLGTGIYFGDAHRDTVLNVESFVLGRDVRNGETGAATEDGDVVEAMTTTRASAEAKSPASLEEAKTRSGGGEAVAEERSVEVAATKVAATKAAAATTAAPADEPAAGNVVEAAAPAPAKRDPFAPRFGAASGSRLASVARRPAVPDDLVGAYMAERRLNVRVLVDPALVTLRPDWIDYVQRVVSVASANLRALAGVELSLHGVGRIDDVVPSGEAGLAFVKEVSLEGADLLLVFTAPAKAEGAPSAIPGHAAGHSLVVAPSKRRLGARAVIAGSPGMDMPHTWSVLHEVAHLMGAEDITDVRDPAWSSGSVMSFAPLDLAVAPSIDPENLRRILTRKSWASSDGVEGVEPSHGE